MYLRHFIVFFFFSSRRRHTRLQGDWSSDVCSSDLDRRFGSQDEQQREHLHQQERGDAPGPEPPVRAERDPEIGRASCRERGWIPGGGGAGEKKWVEG